MSKQRLIRTEQFIKFIPPILGFMGLLGAAGCLGTGVETPKTAAVQLNSPGALALSGAGTSGSFIFADTTGAITATNNLISENSSDPSGPFVAGSTAFSASAAAPCALTIAATTVTASGTGVSTSIAATACTDQEVITVVLDNTQITDAAGNVGSGSVSGTFTVDNAPIVATQVTGNSDPAGNGTAGTVNSYNSQSGGDQSIVVVFNKSMAGGTFNATLTPNTTADPNAVCAGTIASSGLVTNDTTNATVFWTLTGENASDNCVFSVAAVTDAAGNPVDPSTTNDPNFSMTLTIQ